MLSAACFCGRRGRPRRALRRRATTRGRRWSPGTSAQRAAAPGRPRPLPAVVPGDAGRQGGHEMGRQAAAAAAERGRRGRRGGGAADVHWRVHSAEPPRQEAHDPRRAPRQGRALRHQPRRHLDDTRACVVDDRRAGASGYRGSLPGRRGIEAVHVKASPRPRSADAAEAACASATYGSPSRCVVTSPLPHLSCPSLPCLSTCTVGF